MEPYLGEIRLIAFDFAPQGWAFCNGQLLPISQNAALSSLIGNTYGGDGKTTFALPNLQCQVPLHTDYNQFQFGKPGGEAMHTLTSDEVPPHTHLLTCATSPGAAVTPIVNVWAKSPTGVNVYGSSGSPSGTLAASSVSSAGGGSAHENRPPYLVLNYIIALKGVYPPRP